MGGSSQIQKQQYSQNQNTQQQVQQNQQQQAQTYGTETGTVSGAGSQVGTQTGTTSFLPQAQPSVYGLLSGVNTQLPNTGPNANETNAINSLIANAQGLPNWQPQAVDLTNRYLSGDPTGLLNPALQNYNTQLNPIATGDLDPTKTPGIQNLLQTIKDDTFNQIRGTWNGAGREGGSGGEQQALERGYVQGIAPTLVGQYNTNVRNRLDASNALLGGANTVAGAMTGNYAAVPGAADYALNAGNTGANATLAAEALRRGISLDSLQKLTGVTVPIAGLGQQTTNQVQQNTTTQQQAQTESQKFAQALSNMLANATGQSQTQGQQTTQTQNNPSLLSTLLQGGQLAGQGAGLLSLLLA